MKIEAVQTEKEKRLRRCCFTGHRPEKLSLPEEEVIAWLEAEILKAIDDGFVTFISRHRGYTCSPARPGK